MLKPLRNITYAYIIAVFLISSTMMFSQLSKVHYIPPMPSAGVSNAEDSFESVYIYLSTPESEANFTIKPLGSPASEWITGSVTNANSYKLLLDRNVIGAYTEDPASTNVFQDKGYHVTSDKEMYVSVRARHRNHAGAIVSKGLDGYGKRFRVAGMERTATNNDSSFFSIVSTQDNNAISFTADASLLTSKGTTLPTDLVLNKDEVFIVSFSRENIVKNIGTLITSTKDIVVTTGTMYGSFSNEIIDSPPLTADDNKDYFTGGDMGMDQLVSITPAVDATAYIIVKGDSFNSIENALIIADEDGTQININGVPYKDPETGQQTLNAGDHFFVEGTSYSATSPLQYMHITSNKNVYVFQGTGDKFTNLSNNGTRHNYAANQGMFFVPPLNCASTGDVERIARIDEVDDGSVGSGGAFAGSVFVLSTVGSIVTLNGSDINTIADAQINVPIGGIDSYTLHRANNVSGDVAVVGSDELYVSYFNVNSAATSGAFYSGFTLEPKISPELSISTLGSCLYENGTSNVSFNISSAAYSGFDEFKWQKKNEVTTVWENIFGATTLKDAANYIPRDVGQYRAAAKIYCLNDPEIFSESLVVGFCPADFDQDGVIDNLDDDKDNDGIYNALESYGDFPLNLTDVNAPTVSVPTGATTTTIGSSITNNGATVSGDATGRFTSSFNPASVGNMTAEFVFDNSITLVFSYASSTPHAVSDKETFEIKSINIKSPITLLNPNNELLIDTNLDGIYESDIQQYSASSIRFAFNSSVAFGGAYGFSFIKTTDGASDGIIFSHEVSNNTSASAFDANLTLVNYGKDSDGDGLFDEVALDSDGDGCYDFIEAGFTDEENTLQFGSTALSIDAGNIKNDGAVAAHDYSKAIHKDSAGNYYFQQAGTQATISNHPKGATITEGDVATFSISSPDAASYQWFMDGVAITNNGTFGGANTNTLTVNTSDTTLDGKTFTVSITADDYLCANSSRDAILSILAAPSIPVLDRVYSFCFSGLPSDIKTVDDLKKAIGRTDINIYEEELGGTPLTDATPLVTTEDYFVSAVNVLGDESVIRSVTNVIIANPQLSSSVANDAVCIGGTVTLNASGVPQTVAEFEKNLDSTYEKFLTFGGSQYFLKKDPLPWTSARNLIKSLGAGASMYVINSKSEETAVYNELERRGYAGTAANHFWLGLRQVNALKNGQVDEGWVWLDGRLLTATDANWAAQEPNDYPELCSHPNGCKEEGNEDYGQFDYDPGRMEWNDMADNGGGGNSWPIFEFEGVSDVKWYKQETGGTKTLITSAESNSLTDNPTKTTTYFYEINVNGVICFDSVTITVLDAPKMLPADDMTACDNNLDGDSSDMNEATFDLAQQALDIVAGTPQRDVRFFTSLTSAQALSSSITTTTPFPNTANPQKIYYRIVNTDTGCISSDIESFDLIVENLPPELNIPNLTACDDDTVGNDKDGKRAFDLTQNTPIILNLLGGAASTYEISYHTSLNNAKNGVNIDTSVPFKNTVANRQLIYVRIKNVKTGCMRYDNSFSLIVDALPTATTASLVVEQCESDGQIKYNLTTLTDRFSTNHVNETFEFYTDPGLTAIITNPENYVVPLGVFNQTVYVKIRNNKGCERFDDVFTAGSAREPLTVTFGIGANNMPAGFAPLTFYDCLAVDALTVDTGEFDSSIFGDIETALLAAEPNYNMPNVVISYYRSEEDAIYQRNAIDTSKSVLVNPPLRTQEVWAGIQDVGVSIKCLGRIKVANLLITPVPSFDLPSTQVFCTNSGSDVINITNQGGTYDYVWTRNSLPFSQTTADITITEGGTYEVTATNTTTGCSTVKTIVVDESEFPLFDLQDITTFDLTGDGSNRVEVLTGVDALGIGDYEFSLDGEPFQDSSVFEDVLPGIHTLYVRDKKGCGTADLPVSVIGYPLYFTPNNNGKADTWQVLGVNDVFQAQSLIYIFDRHGRLLAQIAANGPGWDGTYNGAPMPADDYWFRVKLEDGRAFTGHFSLMR